MARERLLEMYSPGMVEFMERNPLFADRLMHLRASSEEHKLLLKARWREREWRGAHAEECLRKIREYARCAHGR